MKYALTLLSAAAMTTLASAATLSNDFDGSSAGTWSTVGSVNTGATGNTGLGAEAAAGATNYIYTNDAFTSTVDISGSFDFYIVENGNYTNGAFFFGDLSSGLGSTAGDHLRVDLREQTFGARANILDADGTTLFNGGGNNLYQIATNTWYSASFTWTASTGDFSFSWGGTEGPMTVNSYVLNSPAVQFGFGTVDDGAIFDNIVLDGTIYVVPEPSVALLGSLGALALLRRRRR